MVVVWLIGVMTLLVGVGAWIPELLIIAVVILVLRFSLDA